MTPETRDATPATAAGADTREQLLDAAESLIADQGVDGASVRAITDAAGANLAAISYHFGSKDELVKAVFERRLEPINRERLRLLDEAEGRPEGPTLEDVVRAFVTPPLAILDPDEAPSFGRCMIRALADPGPEMKTLLMKNFESVIARFTTAFATVLPDRSHEEIFWRFHFMVGSMAYTVGMGHLVEEYSRGACCDDDPAELAERLVRFVCAGMSAEETTP